ncbi:MAG: OmpH family outer membrane protein [Bacteroidota bacterium]
MKKLLFVFCVVAVSTATAQTSKIAYVNSETILRELPEAQQAQKELEGTLKGWQDELEKMGKDLQEGLDDYQKKQALMDPTAKAAKEKSLQDLQQKAREYQYQKFDTREGEAVKLREKKLSPIQEKVLKAIEAVAKEDGFQFVFDKISNASNVLYADAKFDLTYKVIDRLKRGTATKSKDSK